MKTNPLEVQKRERQKLSSLRRKPSDSSIDNFLREHSFSKREISALYIQEEEEEEEIQQSYFIILPDSAFRIFWNIVLLMFILYQAISIPYRLGFSLPQTGGYKTFEDIITGWFLADILINLNTGFYRKGNLITNRKEVAKYYFKFWFWLDLVASFPYDWVMEAVAGDSNKEDDGDGGGEDSLYKAPQLLRLIKLFRFLRILKLIRICKLKQILIKMEDFITSNTFSTIFLIFKLLAVIIFIAHWTACWFYFISFEDSFIHSDVWIRHDNLMDKDISDIYITALYWSFTTMTTVGYGDIVPRTSNEKLYVMASMILACGIFAYTVGSIGGIISKQSAEENLYRERTISVNRYMKKHNLSADLQFRVRRYLEYVWENQKNNFNEKEILALLSEPLRDEIYAHIHANIIKTCEVFVALYEVHFIAQLSKTFTYETFAPGDVILEEGELSTEMYFITSGKIDIYHSNTNSSFQELAQGSYFGEIAFFTELPRCASARCLDFVDMLSLNRENFDQLTEKFPDAAEATKIISRQCKEDDFTSLLVKCYICKDLGHVSTRCKKVLINFNHEQIKEKWLEKRSKDLTNFVNPGEVKTDKKKKRKRRPKFAAGQYTSKNIIGMPMEPSQLYPEGSTLAGLAQNYRSNECEIDKRQSEIRDMRKKYKPQYTIIFRDSSSSEAEAEPEEPPRSLAFQPVLRSSQIKFPQRDTHPRLHKKEMRKVRSDEPEMDSQFIKDEAMDLSTAIKLSANERNSFFIPGTQNDDYGHNLNGFGEFDQNELINKS